ncbi:LCP family protein [Chitinispirillales bacterium ANBcel5]|uniref:LCP family glycopolymer transferase n=1 Tax=Cellulosispirillum alkaliphilum TaxID=3039283 RepID=UPI002A57BD4C|nr:LCP family protein [Chitinispirillales bacterium ANBcel5]
MKIIKYRAVTCLLYLVVSIGILWQIVLLLRNASFEVFEEEKHVFVSVQGNVRKPGKYKVPVGITEFEILKVAGIRPTSDISTFGLLNQVVTNSMMQVGSLNSPISLYDEENILWLENFTGEITLIGAGGAQLPQQQGTSFSQGDRIRTEATSQIELSLGFSSSVDMDNFSEIEVIRASMTDQQSYRFELMQRTGLCWYRIKNNQNRDAYKINTPYATVVVGGEETEFFIDIQGTDVFIGNKDGLLLVERSGSEESVNLISGQQLKIAGIDDPFEITRIPADSAITERFTGLSEQRMKKVDGDKPLNFLFCAPPHTYYIISLQFETGVTHIVELPSELLVEQFVQGFSTLGQAFLYGGPVLVSILAERVLNIEVSNYCVVDRNDIIRIVNTIGGVDIDLDLLAASALNMPQGQAMLAGEHLVHFLSPEISGAEGSRRRQAMVLRQMFNKFRNQNVIMTALLADQLLSNIETNFSPGGVMNHYNRFASGRSWRYMKHTIPGETVMRHSRPSHEPDLSLSRKLLVSN